MSLVPSLPSPPARVWALLLVGALVIAAPLRAQNWGDLTGTVTEIETGLPIPGVTVLVAGTDFGTATNAEGRYTLRMPVGRQALRFSAIGYTTRVDSVTVRAGPPTVYDVRLAISVTELEGVTVEERRSPEAAGVFDLDPETIRDIPAPFDDGFRALKVVPGVASNNELSYQYSVRGGGYNENLIFINGFEVYMPFRPRQGEQEGLGLLNPELAGRMTLYTGGFSARYGGKLSSALEADYRRPDDEPFGGSAYVSTLDAGLTAGSSLFQNRVGWVVGARKAQARRFFGTQELKGNYQPDYTDVQAYVNVRLAPGHTVDLLGIYADHDFLLDPRSRKTYFGYVGRSPDDPSNLEGIWVDYNSASTQQDGYGTRFAGARLANQLAPRVKISHSAAYFETDEQQFLDLRGQAYLYRVDPGGDVGTGTGHLQTGTAALEDGTDNRIRVKTWTVEGTGQYTTDRHAVEAGWLGRRLRFDDRLIEKSVVRGADLNGDLVRIVTDSLTDAATFDALQAAFYVQDTADLLPTRDRLVVTAGVRADYFDFNGQWTVSPRLSARYRWTTQTTLLGSAGFYYQAPTYRELRGKPAPGQTILGALNRDLKAQRSLQVVGGVEHFFERRRLYLRAEAYYKHLRDLISYDIENVRILYSGENDAEGYAYGLDLQVRGEFVPGLESWVNYGYLVAREDFLPGFETSRTEGLSPRPMDQRHTMSVFLQDYVPTDPTWKIHLRGLLGTGFPYTPPVPGDRSAGYLIQVPGDRLSARYPAYRRIDLGATKTITVAEQGLNGPIELQLTAEVLNLFDMTNTVAYAWIPGGDGIWKRVPTRLTPRTVNVRLRMTF